MARYPLKWGVDPNPIDDSPTTDSSPATGRYPLEWGPHLKRPDYTHLPEFTAVMPTLLGGADPDIFPIGRSRSSSTQAGPTPASSPPDGTASDAPQVAQAGMPPANDNRTAHETCDQAFAESNAMARIHPSLSPDQYLAWRKEAREVYDFCLKRADHPAQRADRIEFPGGGVVIIRRGLAPLYVPPPPTGRAN